ncbi:MAG: antitoxin Xre/MbcA/ParS toxin-binding domain-containing protein [Verrucomicrobiia bacterium]|jgi:putative toxin-antitoxin system antitoxin component (TIGR02293 family)
MKHSYTASQKGARLVRERKASSLARSGSGRTHFFISYYVEPRGMPTTAKTFSPQEVIEVINRGLPIGELEYLRSHLDVPIDRLTQNIGLSRATFHRRKAAGRLTSDESDKVVRFAQLLGLANRVLENEDDARRWLTSPQFGLGGAVPLNYARTEVGAREVEDLLNRIEYGVYS